MKKVKKYIDYALSLVSKAIREKKYRNENSTLKYLFYPCKNSKDMVVVFSACTRVGIPARYNYIRTLDNIEVNRLYIWMTKVMIKEEVIILVSTRSFIQKRQ